MNKRAFTSKFVIITVMLLTVSACGSDIEMNYDINDIRNYDDANNSLTGQFEAIWRVLNFNYPEWDNEAEYGVDWDNIHDKYLPIFQSLDGKYSKENPVPDSIIWNRYNEIMACLHDGHIKMNIKNIHNNSTISKYFTPDIRPLKYQADSKFHTYLLQNYMFQPKLEYYVNNHEVTDYYECNYTDNNLSAADIVAVFNDSILYYYLPNFNLSQDEKRMSLWAQRFDKLQKLKVSGSLKGVIFDLRNNAGGDSNGYQYLLGATHQSDSCLDNAIHVGYLREKTGLGRLDFSELYQFNLPVFPQPHSIITEPIVILADSLSRSAAEITCLAGKQKRNVVQIGTETWGCFSAHYNVSNKHYAGWSMFGDPELEKVSFYINMPYAAFHTKEDKKIIEGKGVEPDINIILDRNIFNETGSDNQIERAIEYIRTGK